MKSAFMKFSWMLAPVFACMVEAQSLEFSKTEWDNPGLSGSAVWLKNDDTKPVRIEALFVRDNGIRKYNEIAMKAGTVKRYFKVTNPAHGLTVYAQEVERATGPPNLSWQPTAAGEIMSRRG